MGIPVLSKAVAAGDLPRLDQAGAPRPEPNIAIFEDFFNPPAVAANATASYKDFIISGSGGTAANSNFPGPQDLGQLRLNGAATTNSQIRVALGTYTNPLRTTTVPGRFAGRFLLSTVNARFRFGFFNDITLANPVDGLFFETNNNATCKFIGVSNSVASTYDTTKFYGSSTWRNLECRILSDGTLQVYFDNVLLTTLPKTTTRNDQFLQFGVQILSNTTTASSYFIDYLLFESAIGRPIVA